MVSKIFLAFAFFTLAGCVTTRPIIGPDGTQHHLVSCLSVEVCYSRAREVCSGNYTIVKTSSDVSGGDKGTSTTTNLLVKCQRF